MGSKKDGVLRFFMGEGDFMEPEWKVGGEPIPWEKCMENF